VKATEVTIERRRNAPTIVCARKSLLPTPKDDMIDAVRFRFPWSSHLPSELVNLHVFSRSVIGYANKSLFYQSPFELIDSRWRIYPGTPHDHHLRKLKTKPKTNINVE